ncbi:glycosyltransferase [Bacteroides acidifaciens]|uniref:glycosyltransferase n=1 Tax=Bacteroides acidifaciens TaxID=85831 RepID=UPI00158A47FA|nr:glycosyltransferase [Bacteroides acidifaciens]
MNTNPRITVLMSVYNGEKFLREAIDSILNQTYKDFEFVIYDDCSTDSTSEIIKSYHDLRIVYRPNVKNQGLTWNLADGVLRSKSDYIARMDADDIAYQDRLQKQIEWMDTHKDITILGTSVSYFAHKPGDGSLAKQPEGDEIIKATLFISFTLMHPSIMIRRADLENHHLNYNPDYRCSQDHALYLDCICEGLKFANMSEPLLYMRAHAESISKAKHGFQQECSQRARLNFLKKTELNDGCTDFEVETYNTFASGYYPDTIKKVRAYENFALKVTQNPKTSEYFNGEILKRLMAEKLCNGAYHVIEDKKYRRSSLIAINSKLKTYISQWSLKQKIKFYIKLLKSYI